MSEAEMYYRQVNCLTVHEHPILGKKHHKVIEMMEDFNKHQTELNNNEVLDLVSVSFADYLISDFEMVSEGVEEELLWQLCGTKQRYTSEEIYNVFINER